MVKFGYTILYVKNVAKTVAFYEVAFGFECRFISPEKDYAELMSGETTLAFAAVDLANSNLKDGFLESNREAKPFGMEIGFVTDDVEALVNKAVAAGATLTEAPKNKPWGQIVAYVRDLDGFLIEICTAMS
jgi:lactoylglutathione lyase